MWQGHIPTKSTQEPGLRGGASNAIEVNHFENGIEIRGEPEIYNIAKLKELMNSYGIKAASSSVNLFTVAVVSFLPY